MVDSEACQYLLCVLLVPNDVVEDGLSVVLGDVLRLTDMNRHIFRILTIWLVRILLLTRHPSPPSFYPITLLFTLRKLLYLGGIFVGISSPHFTVTLTILNQLSLDAIVGPELNEVLVKD